MVTATCWTPSLLRLVHMMKPYRETILYNLTLDNHYQNQNFLSLGTHTSNNTSAEKLCKWKITQLLIQLANIYLCYAEDGCQEGSQTKVVITVWSCRCQFETQRSTKQCSPSLVPAGPSPLQPQFILQARSQLPLMWQDLCSLLLWRSRISTFSTHFLMLLSFWLLQLPTGGPQKFPALQRPFLK